MKVLLILVDGMRPDSLDGIDFVNYLKKESSYCLNACTVVPSGTLSAIMSLSLSVTPQCHGVISNEFTPMFHSYDSIFEHLKNKGKQSAFYYSWEQLRDISKPAYLTKSVMYNNGGDSYGFRSGDEYLYREFIESLKKESYDFSFLYLGLPDAMGHDYGWMSSEYIEAVKMSWKKIEQVMRNLGDEYITIITADHGGHERTHGTSMPEDVLIPLFIHGKGVNKGEKLNNISILDIAPTIAKLLSIPPSDKWEGKSIIDL